MGRSGPQSSQRHSGLLGREASELTGTLDATRLDSARLQRDTVNRGKPIEVGYMKAR